MSRHRLFSNHPTLATVALGALLATASLTLSQCTQVGDQLTGVSLSSHKPVSCKKSCQEDFNTLQKQENALHKASIKACDGDDACRDAETARHTAAMQQLTSELQACKASCHKQGSGTAG